MTNLRDELQRIYDTSGALTPQAVVDEARPRTSPLHSRFDWDNKTAGEAWRRAQARELIRSVKVVYREATELEEASTVRVWHAVRGVEQGHEYEPADKVAADPFLSALVLRDMEREWKQLQRRYGHFAEFVEMVTQSVAEIA